MDQAADTPKIEPSSAIEQPLAEFTQQAAKLQSPPDEGYAWVFLAGAFFAESLVFGYAFSAGVLHEVWVTELFTEDPSITALAATLQAGLPCLLLPLASVTYQYLPRYRRALQFFGLFTACAGILASAYVTKPWHLVMSLGLSYGLGGAFYYYPATAMLFDWFVRRRGLAGGIIYAASGVGGTAIPFIIQALMKSYSYRTTMISSAVGYFILGLPVIAVIRPRTTHDSLAVMSDSPKGSVLQTTRHVSFWALAGAMLAFALGMVVPNIYLPLLAQEFGLEKQTGIILVAVMNASSAFGMVFLGFLADHLPIHYAVPIGTGGAALASLLLGGLSTGTPMLIVFAIAFGFFGVGSFAFAPKMVTVLAKGDLALSEHLISIFLAVTGAGNIVSGPIATALEAHTRGDSKFIYGGPYGSVLGWTGGVMLASAICAFSVKYMRFPSDGS